jgi:hypothetical protein
MIDIAASVDEGGERVEQFAEVAGVSAQDFTKQWKTDPGAALAGFVAGLGDAEAQGESTLGILEDLGITEVRMRDALLRSAAASDQFTAAMDTGNGAIKDNNALAEEAAKRYATVESQLEITKNKVIDASISFGQVFLPAVEAASNAVGGIADALGAMDPTMQGVVAAGVLLTGGIALVGGAALVALPKNAAFQVSLGILATSSMPAVATAATGMMTATTRATTAMGTSAKFMMGPWGLAIAAAVVGASLLAKTLDSVQASSDEVKNSLLTATSAAQVLAVVGEGKEWKWLYGAKEQLSDLPAVLQASADQSENVFARFDQTHFGAFDALREIGDELAGIASSDLPAAQNAFRLLTEETDGSEKSQWRLLNSMPGYLDALKLQANELGINVTSADEAANKTALLEMAFGDATPVALDAADAYLAAADESAALADEVGKLMDAINEANGVGQDAVSSNATYQASLAGISDEVERQKEEFIKLQEDGYKEANGTLDGFVGTLDGFKLSLDESTASGSANAAMLSGVASDAQSAALAQFEVDKTTMSAKDATEKYITTLGLSREELRKQAEANGYSADEVQKLIDKVFALPTEKETKLLMETNSAELQLDAFKNKWDGVKITGSLFMEASNGDRSMAAAAARYTGQAQAYANRPGAATGGTIRGPGTGTSDSIPVMLSNGEEVTRASMADKFRPLLKAINADRVPGYATGGTVGYASSPQYAPNPGNGGSSAVSVATRVSLAGATFAATIDGRPITMMIQEQMVSASNARDSKIRRN